ncbi:hypothetical protein G3N56_03710 [Desulfovibrio sulfodismutans]|uniref:Uncharacterized protein n=1 Tax=Desulfolutivibrio sulfodismutans TaxID=63561 RepID=A0A7K3NIC6_9BACT|nr:hypothetical protein [Desulfolutivibrio sulfodismutans]NDY55847.1 hypothetical protein [Desulfolutivibrio sulfodismutans]QLA14249.1 hypothetical protein GD606_19250 [Desulfolutivibrio sulfodismutans DSM 3696]
MIQDLDFKTEFVQLSEAIKARNAAGSSTTKLAEHLFNSSEILSSPYLKNWGGGGCYYHCEIVYENKDSLQTKNSSTDSVLKKESIRKIVVDFTFSSFMWNNSIFFAVLYCELDKKFKKMILQERVRLCHALNKNILPRAHFLNNDIIYAETFEDFDVSQVVNILKELHKFIAEKACKILVL